MGGWVGGFLPVEFRINQLEIREGKRRAEEVFEEGEGEVDGEGLVLEQGLWEKVGGWVGGWVDDSSRSSPLPTYLPFQTPSLRNSSIGEPAACLL